MCRVLKWQYSQAKGLAPAGTREGTLRLPHPLWEAFRSPKDPSEGFTAGASLPTHAAVRSAGPGQRGTRPTSGTPSLPRSVLFSCQVTTHFYEPSLPGRQGSGPPQCLISSVPIRGLRARRRKNRLFCPPSVGRACDAASPTSRVRLGPPETPLPQHPAPSTDRAPDTNRTHFGNHHMVGALTPSHSKLALGHTEKSWLSPRELVTPQRGCPDT